MASQANQRTFRGYLIFFGGQTASLLGSSVAQFALIWWITITTGSALLLSLATFIGLAPMVIIMPFAGVLVDRSERRRFIMTADFLQALTTIILIIGFWTGFISLWLVFLSIGLRAICQGFHMPAVNSIVPVMVPRDRLSRMNGLNLLFNGATQLVAPVIAAFFLLFSSVDRILWIDPATFIIAFVALLIIRIPSVRQEGMKTSFRTDFREGLNFILHTKGFIPLFMLATGLNFLLAPLSSLLPYFVKFEHLGTASSLAIVLSCLQAGVLAGGLIMAMYRGFKNKIATSMVFIAILFAGYAVVAVAPVGNFQIMAFGAVIMGFALAPANVLLSTVMQIVTPVELMGRVDSVSGSLSSAATPIGMLLSGVIVALTGTARLFLACSIAGLGLLAFSYFFTDVTLLEKNHSAPLLQEQKENETTDKTPG